MKEPHSIRPPQRVGDANNAAMAYFKAWDMLKLRELQELAGLLTEVEPTGSLQPQLRTLLNTRRDYVDALLAASAMSECRWGPDWEAGWEFLLPHLAYLRTTARLFRADARRCGEDGSLIAAAERVRAMLRVSMHAAEEPVLTSSLVGIAIGVFAANTTEELIERGHVTPATARLLLKAFQEVPREDLYGARLAIEREKQTTMAWLTQQCTGDDAGYDYVKLIRGMTGNDASHMAYMNPMIVMNEQQFQRDLERAGKFYDEVIAAWDRPNAWVRLEELETELKEFQFGLVAIEMTPSVSKARYSVFDIRKKFAKIEKRLAAIAASADEAESDQSAEQPTKEPSQTK